jgi:peptidoglycan-N-acetylglucosamine deacetylase
MTPYWVKTPTWLTRFFPRELIWKMPAEKESAIYLTFDDGPHPEASAFVLEQLKAHDARATFFCIGKNVAKHPDLYHRIISEGHTTGNHTQDHLNGWRTDNWKYLHNIMQAGKLIDSRSYRPPYGRIKISQVKSLSKGRKPWKIYMWDILSGDFDQEITKEQCLENVLPNLEPGSIVVFHDSLKAFPHLQYVLPRVLQFGKEKSWTFKSLPE